jgi:hypothetical protein
MIPAVAASVALLLSAGLVEDRESKPPSLLETDRIRIAEAFRLADALGDRVWPGWSKAPFAVLLVTPEYEFLIRHPKPSDDFTLIGDDPVLKEKVWFRKRQFSTRLLATFPAVNGLTTIVIGQAEGAASNTSARWVITLLHEHFHQLQYSQPRYQAAVDALGLAGSDQTGMWMLNYSFPYTTPAVKEQFAALSRSLAEALTAREADFAGKFAAYVNARAAFQAALSENDRKYLAFQLWQEGVARYTECRLAELAAREYQPSTAFQGLKDYKPFEVVARALRSDVEKELGSVQLDKAKRSVVYNFGAAECLVLDRARPEWQRRYFEALCSLDEHFRAKK